MFNKSKLDNFINTYRNSIKSIDDVDKLTQFIDPISNLPFAPDEKKYVREILSSQFIKVQDPASIIDRVRHIDWYQQWLIANGDSQFHWFRVKNLLFNKLSKKNDSKKTSEIIQSIDRSSFKILENMEHPNRDNYQSKGLVVGFVQSGKTQNFTAVIAKAVDSGYKVIVVLAGMHDNLRSQTQSRLDCELIGKDDGDGNECLPHAMDRFYWEQLTEVDSFELIKGSIKRISGEFKKPPSSFNSYINKNHTVILIVKKNASILERLFKWIEKSDLDKRNKIPLLMIDDEADQASIDSNSNRPDKEATKINGKIRKILNLFIRHSYIGYTATPFANILIDLNSENLKLGKDLYPANFIVSLPKPVNYWGAYEIFSSSISDILVKDIIEDDEAKEFKNGNPKNKKLEESIKSFIIACAIRCFRGDEKKPMSMLIHTSMSNSDQALIKQYVELYVHNLKSLLKDHFNRERIMKEFEDLWQKDFTNNLQRVNEEIKDNDNIIPNSFSEIFNYINNILGNDNNLSVLEINAKSEDRLDYNSTHGIKVIAIGGNKLSRGLTLEGLMTSFYIRKSKQYDTLLQMGRWFGYRQGYEDLVRVYTTKDLKESFDHLATVENELREEIKRYEDEDKTPADLAIHIKAHRSLQVTSKAKMGKGSPVKVSYSGGLSQTIWFPLDNPNKLRKNLFVGKEFIKELFSELGKPESVQNESSHLWRNVDINFVLKFLHEYEFVENTGEYSPGLDSVKMLEYIKRVSSKGELQKWSVALIGQSKELPKENEKISFGLNEIKIIPRKRSRLKNYKYKIGVLSDPNHFKIDGITAEERKKSNSPLLLLYVIWSGSEPDKPTENTEALFKDIPEKVDVLGIVIDFPKSKSEPHSYIGQILEN